MIKPRVSRKEREEILRKAIYYDWTLRELCAHYGYANISTPYRWVSQNKVSKELCQEMIALWRTHKERSSSRDEIVRDARRRYYKYFSTIA